MRAKLGLPASAHDELTSALVEDLIQMLQEPRRLHDAVPSAGCRARGDAEPARCLFLELARIDDWMQRWRALGPDPELMDRTNPVYIPRNHLVEEALTAATAGDLRPFEQLLEAVTRPYDERPGLERYAAPAPEDFGRYQTFCGTYAKCDPTIGRSGRYLEMGATAALPTLFRSR